jgi:hypothetical protein
MISTIPSQIRRQAVPRLVIALIAGFAGPLRSGEIARVTRDVVAGQVDTRGLVIVTFIGSMKRCTRIGRSVQSKRPTILTSSNSNARSGLHVASLCPGRWDGLEFVT